MSSSTSLEYAHSVMSDMTKKYMDTIQKLEHEYNQTLSKLRWENEWLHSIGKKTEEEVTAQQSRIHYLQNELQQEKAKITEAMEQVNALDQVNQRQAKLLESYQDELHGRELEILNLKAKSHVPETIAPSTSPIGFVVDSPSPISHNTTCWGCRENQPNQLAHMDMGGCLYSDDNFEL